MFGVLVFFWPSISLVMLVLLFGGYALADGVFALACAIEKATDNTSERKQPWWPMLLQGVVGIAASGAHLCMARHHRLGVAVSDRRLGHHR